MFFLFYCQDGLIIPSQDKKMKTPTWLLGEILSWCTRGVMTTRRLVPVPIFQRPLSHPIPHDNPVMRLSSPLSKKISPHPQAAPRRADRRPSRWLHASIRRVSRSHEAAPLVMRLSGSEPTGVDWSRAATGFFQSIWYLSIHLPVFQVTALVETR